MRIFHETERIQKGFSHILFRWKRTRSIPIFLLSFKTLSLFNHRELSLFRILHFFLTSVQSESKLAARPTSKYRFFFFFFLSHIPGHNSRFFSLIRILVRNFSYNSFRAAGVMYKKKEAPVCSFFLLPSLLSFSLLPSLPPS